MHVGVPAALRGRRRALHPLLLASQKRMWVRMGADPTPGSPIGCNADYCNAMGGRRGGCSALMPSPASAAPCGHPGAPAGWIGTPPPQSCTPRVRAAGRMHRAPPAPAEITTPIRSTQGETRGKAAGHPQRVGNPLLVWGEGCGGVAAKSSDGFVKGEQQGGHPPADGRGTNTRYNL